jgi:hypothetical protein
VKYLAAAAEYSKDFTTTTLVIDHIVRDDYSRITTLHRKTKEHQT